MIKHLGQAEGKVPIAAEAMLNIDAPLAIERAINGSPPAERLAVRQATLRLLVDAPEVWPTVSPRALRRLLETLAEGSHWGSIGPGAPLHRLALRRS